MFIRLRPLINTVLRRLGRNTDARRLAIQATVSPEVTLDSLAPIFLPSQIAKITTRAPGQGTLQEEVALAYHSHEVHAPVIRYTLGDCFVHAAGFDVPGGAERSRSLTGFGFLSQPMLPLPAATYCMSNVGHTYFGHWLLDSCATALLANAGQVPLLDCRPDWPHARQYIDALGLQPAAPALYRVARLDFYQDHGLGPSKRARWAQLRERLAQAIPVPPTRERAVYFRRGHTGASRFIVNEEEVAAALAARGFDIVEIGGASVQQLHQHFRHARVVVSMEGSHLNHLYLCMRPGSCILTMIPADRFTLVQLGYANATGLRLAFVVLPRAGEGYRVDIPDLLATLDLAA